MNIIFAHLKKDFRINQLALLTFWLCLVASMVFSLSSRDSSDNYSNLLQVIPVLAYVFTAAIYAQDSSSDIHAFWRTQPISVSQILAAKFIFVFVCIVVPVVAVHWFSLQRLPINLAHYQVVEPLTWFTVANLSIGLLVTVCGAYRVRTFLFFIAVFWVLTFLSYWLRSRFGVEVPTVDGRGSVIILVGAVLLLIVAHRACYLRRGFKFQITVVTATLITTWFAAEVSGSWFHKPYSPQPLKALDIEEPSSEQISLHYYESYSFDQTKFLVFANINLTKPIRENLILTSLSQLRNPKGATMQLQSDSGFDRGPFNFAHAQLGFATNEDRILGDAVLNLAWVEEQDWSKLIESPTDIDAKISYIEPQITTVADIPFNGEREIFFRDQTFRLNTKIFDQSRFVISLKGISTGQLMMNVVLYNPTLKELVLTGKSGGHLSSVASYLNRPKLLSARSEWQANPRVLSKAAILQSSTGYKIITKPPTREWLEQARILVYKIDHSTPVVQDLTIDQVDLSNLSPAGSNLK